MHDSRRSGRQGWLRMTKFALLAAGAAFVTPQASGQQVTYEQGPDGRQYEVRTQTVQETVPVTEMRAQQQTIYRPQVTTNNYEHQQLVTVPVTQYQLVSRLHGRWNPFAQPYWTHHYEPVTTWHQQVAKVQVPVNQIAWQSQVQTVQVPVTTYRTAEKTITTRVAVNDARPLGGNTAIASVAPTPQTSGPSATIAAVGSSPAAGAGPAATLAARPNVITSSPVGGKKMASDPPREGTGWNSTTPYERYK